MGLVLSVKKRRVWTFLLHLVMISKLQKTKRHKKSVLKSSCRVLSYCLGTDTFEYTIKTIKKSNRKKIRLLFCVFLHIIYSIRQKWRRLVCVKQEY